MKVNQRARVTFAYPSLSYAHTDDPHAQFPGALTLHDFNTCVDMHSDGVYRFALKHLRDTDTAKDVVQDSFARLWQKVEDVDAARAKGDRKSVV